MTSACNSWPCSRLRWLDLCGWSRNQLTSVSCTSPSIGCEDYHRNLVKGFFRSLGINFYGTLFSVLLADRVCGSCFLWVSSSPEDESWSWAWEMRSGRVGQSLSVF